MFISKCGFEEDLKGIAITLLLLFFIVFASYKFIERKTVPSLITISCAFILICTYYFVSKNNGENYLSSRTIHHEKVNIKNSVNPVLDYLTFDTQKVQLISVNNESPNTFIIGDSHTGHYLDFFCNEYNHSIYYLASSATMAYGKQATSYKTEDTTVALKMFTENRKTFYELYKSMLNQLEDGSKVILSNNWYVHYIPYLFQNNYEQNDDTHFNEYVREIVFNLKEQIELHKNIKFYIVGQGVYMPFKKMQCTQLDLSDSFLRFFISQSGCNEFSDSKKIYTDIINKSLKEFADSYRHVYFIDRNKPIEKAPLIFSSYCDEKKTPLYQDEHHYSNEGGRIIARYIMEQIEK